MVPWKTTFLYEQGVNSTSMLVTVSESKGIVANRCTVSGPDASLGAMYAMYAYIHSPNPPPMWANMAVPWSVSAVNIPLEHKGRNYTHTYAVLNLFLYDVIQFSFVADGQRELPNLYDLFFVYSTMEYLFRCNRPNLR